VGTNVNISRDELLTPFVIHNKSVIDCKN